MGLLVQDSITLVCLYEIEMSTGKGQQSEWGVSAMEERMLTFLKG